MIQSMLQLLKFELTGACEGERCLFAFITGLIKFAAM